MSLRRPVGTAGIAAAWSGTRGIAAILCGISLARAASEPAPLPLPGPTRSAAALRARLGNPAHAQATRASCTDCHAEIGEEWRNSLHRRSWQDTVFQSAYTVEPLAFCRGCHAPGSDPAKAPTAAAAEAGVDCVTCHVQRGGIVGPGGHTANADHPVFADTRWATASACSGCHQFDFPKSSRQVVPQAMQSTAHEHELSRFADIPCQSCHMPVVGEGLSLHRSHDFSVLGNPDLIRGAATVEATRVAADRVAVTITARSVGHAFPTGDMFRRLEVRAESRNARGDTLARLAPVVLARRFADVPRSASDLSFQRVQVGDDRVPAPGAGAPRRVLFTVPPGPNEFLHFQVVYQRMSAPMASTFRVDRALDEIVVAEGDVPLSPLTPLSKKERHP
jgi:hypothetical protein